MQCLLTSNIFPDLKNHTNFDPNAGTLENWMLKGEHRDKWISTCEKLGEFLAMTRANWNTVDISSVCVIDSIKKHSVLGEWIESMNGSWESIISMATINLPFNVDSAKIQERGLEATKMMRKAETINFDNLVTKNVQLLSTDQQIQINPNDVYLVYGPLGLETSVFLADVLIKYHQQLRLEHSIRYVTSECAKSFGRAYENKANRSENDAKIFWSQTSLLTGWEMIRRVIVDEKLHESSRRKEIDLSDVFQAGLRLVYNQRIDNAGLMILVALAEL